MGIKGLSIFIVGCTTHCVASRNNPLVYTMDCPELVHTLNSLVLRPIITRIRANRVLGGSSPEWMVIVIAIVTGGL